MSENPTVIDAATNGAVDGAINKEITVPNGKVKDGATNGKTTVPNGKVPPAVSGDTKAASDKEAADVGTDDPAKPPNTLQQDDKGEVGGNNVPGFLGQMIDALKQIFEPKGDQMFTLQFPGRYLSQDLYAWDTELAGIHGQFVKPVAVNESEFRLADQLYDLADCVRGPNGTNLSIIYEQVLNNFLPRYVDNGLPKQQNQIRDWLIKDVTMTPWIKKIMERQQEREKAVFQSIPGIGASDKPQRMFSKNIKEGETLNRIELSELLMNEYLYAKQDWELERDALINEASEAEIGSPESQKKLNALTRKLAHITTARQAQLASKYSDAVVRGYSHTIKDYMGYLDIASPSEMLQGAKDSPREAAMSSLDGAMKVDWFEGLSTSFTMEDLTQDPEMLRVQIDAKSQQLDFLNSELTMLQLGTKGDPKELEAQVAAAQNKLDAAQSALAQSYTANIIQMAKTCLDAAGKVDLVALSEKTHVAEGVLEELPAQLDTISTAQDALTSSSRALSQLYAAKALAEATDTKQAQQNIRVQIQSLTRELSELQIRWAVLTAETGGVKPPTEKGTGDQVLGEEPLKLPPTRTSGGGRWQELHLTSDSKTRDHYSSARSKSEVEGMSCNFWIGSSSSSSSNASRQSQSGSTATNDSIDIAMRCTLVTIDRGGWFQPQFFKESKAFYKVNKNISWNDTSTASGLMKGFPIAFIIAKDIVIRIRHAESSSAAQKEYNNSASAASGGVLCFSYSKSSSSTSESQSSSFQAFSNGFVVKIPGPQILGYMIQKTPEDESERMPHKLPQNFFIPDDEYNRNIERYQADGIEPDEENKGKEKEPVKEGPKVSVDRLRDVVDKILDEQLDDIFHKITDEGVSA